MVHFHSPVFQGFDFMLCKNHISFCLKISSKFQLFFLAFFDVEDGVVVHFISPRFSRV